MWLQCWAGLLTPNNHLICILLWKNELCASFVGQFMTTNFIVIEVNAFKSTELPLHYSCDISCTAHFGRPFQVKINKLLIFLFWYCVYLHKSKPIWKMRSIDRLSFFCYFTYRREKIPKIEYTIQNIHIVKNISIGQYTYFLLRRREDNALKTSTALCMNGMTSYAR